MNAIDDLTRKVQSLQSQLESAKTSLYAAMVSAERLKVGDIVEVTTPPWSSTLKTSVEVGRVRDVYVRYGDVRVDIAPKTKTGYHAVSTLRISHTSTIRVLESAVSPENKEGA